MVIEKKYHFYAAHRNPDAGEKCGRLHGHTYDIVCYFQFPDSELTMLFGDIDEVVKPIIKYFDHYLILWDEDPLCEVLKDMDEPFIEVAWKTSAENLAQYFYNTIGEVLPIIRVDVKETKTSTVTFE